MRINQCISVAILAFSLIGCQAQPKSARVLTWGDQGDGTYKNPVIKSDYSDPEILRVGTDFYLIASDFHFMGMQVLHSKDLVNWQFISQVYHHLNVDPKYDQMNAYGQGTWAPSMRYHDGQFYIFVCTPYDGLFMWHAKNPAGPWSNTVTVKAIPKWEDPCPFWDDDGQAYLVHSLKGAGPLIINKMKTDGTALLDDGVEIYRGPNAEGPKIQKRHGYYFISLPEGGFTVGWQTMLRSKNIYGPYEKKIVLAGTGLHQGGFVDLDNGQSWFIGFKEQYKSSAGLGRICYLEPVTWGADDWPVFGDNYQPVPGGKKPNVGATFPIARPLTSDEFDSTTLGLQWQWNHNPVDDHWALTDRPGYLRLKNIPADNLSLARNTLTQKLWDDAGVIDIKLDLSGMADGQHCGLAFMTGSAFGPIGVVQTNGQRNIEWENGTGPVFTGNAVWLRETYDGIDTKFFYSLDGMHFSAAPTTFKLGFKNWKGSRPVIFNYGPTAGYVDVDYFHYSYDNTLEKAIKASGD